MVAVQTSYQWHGPRREYRFGRTPLQLAVHPTPISTWEAASLSAWACTIPALGTGPAVPSPWPFILRIFSFSYNAIIPIGPKDEALALHAKHDERGD